MSINGRSGFKSGDDGDNGRLFVLPSTFLTLLKELDNFNLLFLWFSWRWVITFSCYPAATPFKLLGLGLDLLFFRGLYCRFREWCCRILLQTSSMMVSSSFTFFVFFTFIYFSMAFRWLGMPPCRSAVAEFIPSFTVVLELIDEKIVLGSATNCSLLADPVKSSLGILVVRLCFYSLLFLC